GAAPIALRQIDAQVISRLQQTDAFKARWLARNCKEVERLIEAARIGPCWNHSRSEQGLYFGREQEPFAVGRALPGPEERTDAETISAEHDAAVLLVEQSKRKLAAKMLEHSFAVVLPQVRNQLGVAVRGKTMSLGLQQFFLLGIIEQLAVIDASDRAVFI